MTQDNKLTVEKIRARERSLDGYIVDGGWYCADDIIDTLTKKVESQKERVEELENLDYLKAELDLADFNNDLLKKKVKRLEEELIELKGG